MSSESLRSIYQQYKKDTSIVASWLATTAKAFGYSGEVGGDTTGTAPPKPSGRLKGKARKQAAAVQAPDPEPTELSKPKYVLAIKDFVPLAEHIAKFSNDTNIDLPNSFSVALERVIWVRKSFSEKLANAGRRFDLKSDARHSFFVLVLEKVRKTLLPLMSGENSNLSHLKDGASNVEHSRDQKDLSNLFAALRVYEPSAAFEAAPDVVKPSPSEMEYSIETEEDSLFEALFGMTTLMTDLSRLRMEVNELWTNYEQGKIDIAAVSVATNAAIELARNYEDEINHLLQKNGGTSMFHINYFYGVTEAFGIDAEAKQRPTDDYNFAAYDTADTLFINTMINILAFVRANPLDDEIPCYNGLYGWYNEETSLVPGSDRQKYTRMKPALLEVLSDLPLISNHRGPVEDQLLHGMIRTMRMAKTERKVIPDVPIWVSFAAQIYLDTLNVVKIGKGWDEMRRVMRNLKQSVADLPTTCQERRKVLKDLDPWDKNMDPISLIRTSLGKPYKDYTFLRRHFLHCGLWIHNMRILFHQQGVAYAAVPGTVLYTTQLYHALKQEACLNYTWEQLETLRKMQGDSTFFIGEPPSSHEGYFNNFCLTLGSSITNWAPNKRDKKVKVSKDNKPLMKFLGVTSTLAANRIHPFGDRQPISADTIEDWIRQGKNRNGKDAADGKNLQSPTSQNEQKAQPLIDKLAAAVAGEVSDLEFDYFAMHNSCREVLLRLQTESEKVTGPEFTKSYMSHGEHNLAFVVGFVFSTLAGKKNIVTTTVSSTALLEIAARTFNQWLSEGKGVAIQNEK